MITWQICRFKLKYNIHEKYYLQIAELEETIATGNRNLLPIFNKVSDDGEQTSDTKDVSDSGNIYFFIKY